MNKMTDIELNSILEDLSYGEYDEDTNEIEILFRVKFLMSKAQSITEKIDSKSKQLYLERIVKEFNIIQLNFNYSFQNNFSDYLKYHGNFFLDLYKSAYVIIRNEKIDNILKK
jgi:hypothetical protein